MYALQFEEDLEREVDDLKYALAGNIKVLLGDLDLSARIINDCLLETDLFAIKNFCNRHPVFREKVIHFNKI